MTLSGPCLNCGAPLASDQRHCVICGDPVVAPFGAAGAPAQAPPASALLRKRGIPVPPQVVIMASVVALGFGGVIGSAVSPDLETVLAAASAPLSTDDGTRVARTDAGAEDDNGAGSDGGSGAGGGDAKTDPAPAPVPAAPVTTSPTSTDPAAEEPPADPPAEDPPADSEDPPPPDDTTTAEGTVVRVNPNAESYSLASGGVLSTVHAKDLPKPGTEVSVPAEGLFNGTLAEAGERKESGTAKQASFSGTVTFLDEEASLYVLSSPGASIPIRVPSAAGGAPAEMPKLASSITVEVDIAAAPKPSDPQPTDPAAPADPVAPTDPVSATDCVAPQPSPAEPIDPGIALTQSAFDVDFDSLSVTGLEGIVQAVCPELGQIVISADDLRESGRDLTLSLPSGVDPSKVGAGDSISVNADPTPGEDGTLELSGLADDDGSKGADDEKLGQGDKKG